MAKEFVSDEKEKPVLNEEILAKLLEAAWVLQEHNRAQQKVDLSLELHSEQLREREQATRNSTPSSSYSSVSSPASGAATGASAKTEDYTSTLAKIVETQHQIQLRQLDLSSSFEMTLERLMDITKASGAAVGLVEQGKVRYAAGIGPAALLDGTQVEKERALCSDCLRTGQVSRSPDITSEFLFDVEECRRRGIQSFIAVPVYHVGGVAGALELYFSTANAFREADVHSCQLMAGLVTEALARDEEMTWKKSLAEERSVMLDALAKLKPNLDALTEKAAGTAVSQTNGSLPEKESSCESCGAELVAGEQYCGTCGAPRTEDLQTKLGSFLIAQPIEKSTADLQLSHSDPFSPLPRQVPAAANATAHEPHGALATSELQTEEHQREMESDAAKEVALEPLTKSGETATWSSAAKAKNFLEELAQTQRDSAFGRFWNARRGDVYLAVAVILVAIVVRWGIWSERSVRATGAPGAAATTQQQQQADPEADLSLFDKMLISMGLADPPEAPRDKGNPYIRVWVDLHTALYYCPGAELYGKTPKGKYSTQRDAQLDQFEPAYRRNCD